MGSGTKGIATEEVLKRDWGNQKSKISRRDLSSWLWRGESREASYAQHPKLCKVFVLLFLKRMG